ncbi:hypothetical protein KPH14_007891 [Odynerus spinipes]|uniref:Uncharacterized protein n=1 Tax=Odynerus spinipes TaxID=1348599 RepID=A0AAD9S0I7_9HYME|nr:hypothetical protein KPH14_007891 [Odynerus spinipes]
MPITCQGNDNCSVCMPCTPYSPCSPCTIWRQYSPWIQCPPKYCTPHKIKPTITTAVRFGGLKYEARNVLPTPPVLCSPPPYYPVLVGTYPFCGWPSPCAEPIALTTPPPP